jgi:DNA-binding transcriptional ArsR family regulator
MNLDSASSDTLSDIFAALAEPNRRKILALLSGGPETVESLARPLQLSTWGTMKHLRILESSGLVESRKIGRKRVCQICVKPLRDATEWMNEMQTFWHANLARLALHLQTDNDDRLSS